MERIFIASQAMRQLQPCWPLLENVNKELVAVWPIAAADRHDSGAGTASIGRSDSRANLLACAKRSGASKKPVQSGELRVTIKSPSYKDKKCLITFKLLKHMKEAKQAPRLDRRLPLLRCRARASQRGSGCHLSALRAQGLNAQATADLLRTGAFFNWANRLMLSLGGPRYGTRMQR